MNLAEEIEIITNSKIHIVRPYRLGVQKKAKDNPELAESTRRSMEKVLIQNKNDVFSRYEDQILALPTADHNRPFKDYFQPISSELEKAINGLEQGGEFDYQTIIREANLEETDQTAAPLIGQHDILPERFTVKKESIWTLLAQDFGGTPKKYRQMRNFSIGYGIAAALFLFVEPQVTPWAELTAGGIYTAARKGKYAAEHNIEHLKVAKYGLDARIHNLDIAYQTFRSA